MAKRRKNFGDTALREHLRWNRGPAISALKAAKAALTPGKKGSRASRCAWAMGHLLVAAQESGIYTGSRFAASTKAAVRWTYPKSTEATRVHGPLAGALREVTRQFKTVCFPSSRRKVR
jgi:hypothetical protein